jgi:hypothetical protein
MLIELSTVLRELRTDMGLPPGAYVPHELVARALTERMLAGRDTRDASPVPAHADEP